MRENEKRPVQKRFWEKVKKGTPTECWEWQASVRSGPTSGYGQFSIRKNGMTKNLLAHRVAWMLTHGEIPDGSYVCHHCDNRKCVNPAHLFLGSHNENMKDMVKKGRQSMPIPLTSDDVETVFLLVERGYRQADIAKLLGTRQQLISDIITGKWTPKED